MTRWLLIWVGCLAAGLGTAEAQGGKKSGASSPAALVSACTSATFSGAEMTCSCSANAPAGSVWGSGPYTTDSDICTAARHAGVIGGQGGTVSLIAKPGQDSYAGSFSNGIETSSWGNYGQSYAFIGAKPLHNTNLPACGTIPSGVDEYQCYCPENPSLGSVWGDGPYTADSNICAAATHNGLIDAEGGDVTVLRVRGLARYNGSESFGVTTGDWGTYAESIIFDWNR